MSNNFCKIKNSPGGLGRPLPRHPRTTKALDRKQREIENIPKSLSLEPLGFYSFPPINRVRCKNGRKEGE